MTNQRRTWNQDQRQKKKELQKKNWFAKGGYDVPLFVPHTPGGELAKRMRETEAQNHQGRKIRFKIVEKGGVTLEKILRRSNPWSSENCGRADCFPCKGGEGGSCWREGITYTLFCVLYSVLSVERSWQHTLVSLVEMVFQEAKNTVRSTMQKMRTIPSSGCTLYTIIRGEMMSLTT